MSHTTRGKEPSDEEVWIEFFNSIAEEMGFEDRKVFPKSSLQEQQEFLEDEAKKLKDDLVIVQEQINNLSYRKQTAYDKKSKLEDTLRAVRKGIKAVEEEIEKVDYVFNPTVLMISSKCSDFIPCEYRRKDRDGWSKGLLQGFSPKSNSPYKVANDPCSKWAQQIRIKLEDWDDYMGRVLPAFLREV